MNASQQKVLLEYLDTLRVVLESTANAVHIIEGYSDILTELNTAAQCVEYAYELLKGRVCQ